MALDFNEVLPGRLWVGTFVPLDEIPKLGKIGITSIVSLQTAEDVVASRLSLEALDRAFALAGVEFRRSPVRDFDRQALADGLPACVEEVAAALKPPESRVYLHCTAGVNRSPTVAAAYLITYQKLSARDALEYVSARRRCSSFYPGMLESYESRLKLPRLNQA